MSSALLSAALTFEAAVIHTLTALGPNCEQEYRSTVLREIEQVLLHTEVMRGQIYAVVSGLFAALASLCGKYAMAASEAEELCEATLLALNYGELGTDAEHINHSCNQYAVVLRVIFFALMIVVNCIMWTTFTKALRFSSTSLEATITNTAANFFFTAIIGQVLFGEVVRGLWWMGTVLILSGLLLMHHASNVPLRKPGTRPKTH